MIFSILGGGFFFNGTTNRQVAQTYFQLQVGNSHHEEYQQFSYTLQLAQPYKTDLKNLQGVVQSHMH